MSYYIFFSYVSYIGKWRRTNQDNMLCDGLYMGIDFSRIRKPVTGHACAKPPSTFGVFDGMGGEECGEIAAYLAARRASKSIFGRNASVGLMEYCLRANEEICRYAQDQAIASMGTTAAMLVFSPKAIILCNIGDSKILRFSGGRLEQLSQDHVMISAYGIKPPLSQNLGIPKSELLIEPYISEEKYSDGDIYLICTDGLTDMVSGDEIVKIISMSKFNEMAQKLLDKALYNGGKDNITMIVCKVRRNRLCRLGDAVRR